MIFLDVGAHEGQTLEEAVRYDFDRIFAFEPMMPQYLELARKFGDRAECVNVGLGDATERRPVYGSNDNLEASIYPEKDDLDAGAVSECDFWEASMFLRNNIPDGVPVFVKLNCEGSEIPILRNLIASGEIHRITSILVDFDCQHIPGMEDEEARVRRRLEEEGFYDLVTSPDVVPRGHERREEGTYRYTRADEIMCWLKSHGVAER